jgi:hypothetical protein
MSRDLYIVEVSLLCEMTAKLDTPLLLAEELFQ